jgi:hypothetical protein
MIIMPMGWDYISELRPPTGLLLILSDSDTWATRIKVEWYRQENYWLVHQSSVEITRNHLVAKQEKL